jgi:hypothetical protein
MQYQAQYPIILASPINKCDLVYPKIRNKQSDFLNLKLIANDTNASRFTNDLSFVDWLSELGLKISALP